MRDLVDGKVINTIPTYEVAKMMDREHAKVLKMLEGETYKDGKTKVVGIIPVLEADASFRVSDYFIESTYKDASGKTNKCYECTKMGCDVLANKMTGEKGILFAAKYVKRFEEMKHQLEQNNSPSYMIEDPIERAKQWIKEQEEKKLIEKQKEQLQIQLDDSKDYYSIKRVAFINNISWKSLDWRKLKRESNIQGKDIIKIFDSNYGEVNTYHRSVFESVYPHLKLDDNSLATNEE